MTDRSDATVAALGEFEMIRRSLVGRVHPAAVEVGPGDDAAVVAAPDGRTVVTTDMLVEGRHFRLDWSSHHDVGRKAIAQNAADVAAMGARCTGFLVSMSCPSSTTVADVDGLTAGLWEGASAVGASIVGGDVTGGETLVLSITALGDLEGRAPVLRSGARPGDVVAVSGLTGRSAAGWALYGSGVGDYPELLAAHRVPSPDPAEGPRAARSGATAMCDVSDGIVGDVGHVAAASGVWVDLRSERFELTSEMIDAAAYLDVSAIDWAIGGGEDHVLLATFPPGAVPTGWNEIGSVRSGSGVTVDGKRWTGSAPWTSF